MYTASGLASQFPDYALLVVDAINGVKDMTREHLQIVIGLNVLYLCLNIGLYKMKH